MNIITAIATFCLIHVYYSSLSHFVTLANISKMRLSASMSLITRQAHTLLFTTTNSLPNNKHNIDGLDFCYARPFVLFSCDV